jgi:glucuronate isomerase
MRLRPFIHDDFLLASEQAKRLYHEYAHGLPIIDYHCHLPPIDVAEDRRFENLSQAWLEGDHYKWRAMRANGIAERYCTGDASDWEKFERWSATVPKTLRNPLYHWTHMELKDPFGVTNQLLNSDTARGIWDTCNAQLADSTFSARGIMKRMNVVLVCTTDDPVDSLEHHHAIAEDEAFDIKVLPAWRPDKGMAIDDPVRFNAWVDRLAAAANTDIVSMADYRNALAVRQSAFHESGCRLSDHGLDTVYSDAYTEQEIIAIFDTLRGGKSVGEVDQRKFKSAMLYEFGVMNHAKGWTQQFHVGAMRNVNTRQFEALGPDTGFDTIGESELARPFARYLDRLDKTDQLAKTIVYNLNPNDNAVFATLMGNFQDGNIAGKMQLGSAWWFNDQLDGMTRQIEDLSNIGLLSRFVGMLTDSRSFLSYPRHEYFRRLLCNILGNEIENGLLPNDINLIGGMVRDISFNNAREYFDFGLEA